MGAGGAAGGGVRTDEGERGRADDAHAVRLVWEDVHDLGMAPWHARGARARARVARPVRVAVHGERLRIAHPRKGRAEQARGDSTIRRVVKVAEQEDAVVVVRVRRVLRVLDDERAICMRPKELDARLEIRLMGSDENTDRR